MEGCLQTEADPLDSGGRHITSPFPPSGNGGYVRNLDVPMGC